MVVGLSTCIFAAVLLAHFGLIGIGQWQADEYGDFARSAHRLAAFLDRLTWSPRPLSEAVLAAYGRMTLHFQQPLTAAFLGVLWIGFFLSGLAIFIDNKEDRHERAAIGLTGLALMAAFLTTNRLTEVFYWPVGAAAYLPTLSASLYLFLSVARGALGNSAGRLRCGIALLCAALCSETGAFLAISCAVVAAISTAVGKAHRAQGRVARPLGWVLWPAVPAMLVLLVARLYRFRLYENRLSESSATFGHPAASATAALSELVTALLGPGKHGLIVFNLEFLSVALLALGVGLLWSTRGPFPPTHRDDLLGLALALLLGGFLTLAASHLHLGAEAGERHVVIARCWVKLAAASAMIVVLSLPRFQRLRRLSLPLAAAAVCLLGGVLVSWHVKPLLREYSAYGTIRSTIKANFQSGFTPGGDTIEWVLPPNRGVITPATIAPATYNRDSASGYPAYILFYFDKKSIVVRNGPR